MADNSALIAKLEAATEASVELDCDIARAAGWTYIPHEAPSMARWQSPDGNHHYAPHCFSGSLDAALTLLPKPHCEHCWGGTVCVEYTAGKGWHAALGHDTYDGQTNDNAHAGPAIALCIAILKASELPEIEPRVAKRAAERRRA